MFLFQDENHMLVSTKKIFSMKLRQKVINLRVHLVDCILTHSATSRSKNNKKESNKRHDS